MAETIANSNFIVFLFVLMILLYAEYSELNQIRPSSG